MPAKNIIVILFNRVRTQQKALQVVLRAEQFTDYDSLTIQIDCPYNIII
jgi:hypothetical protein